MPLTPSNNTAEITLIGSGGYGESIVVHLGNNKWLIVDSCINPKSKDPLSLEYLESINVDFKNVILIVCTHWHDDHILGLSKVLERCENADFCFSKAHDKDKFLHWIAFDFEKENLKKFNGSTTEFSKCLNIIRARNSNIKTAIENRIIKTIPIEIDFFSQIISLSPSEFTMEEFDKELVSLIDTSMQSNIKEIAKSPNAKSVVLYLKLGFHRAILGADLEISLNPKEGWENIILANEVVDKKASFFKIPHHGSENGYQKNIWEVLLDKKPVSKLTSYNRGSNLPDPNMLVKYAEHTDKLFMTSPTINKKPKKRDKNIEKIIEKFQFKLEEIKYNKGIIRSRINLLDINSNWEIEIIENAFHVNSIIS